MLRLFSFFISAKHLISISLKLLKFVVPCRTFAIDDSPPTNKILGCFCCVVPGYVLRPQFCLSISPLDFSRFSLSFYCSVGSRIELAVWCWIFASLGCARRTQPPFVLFVCLLAPFSSSSNRFRSLRDFIGHLMLRMRVDLLESCFVHFS